MNARITLVSIVLPLVFLFPEQSAIAQHEHHTSASSEPAKLIPGAGNLNHPVSTKNSEAQKFFNQGLALIYGFNHEEARRSFERASQLDPKLAMAHWGIALAVGPNYNEAQVDQSRLQAAHAELEKARELSTNASQAERDYIDALAKRFQLDVDPKKCSIEYKDAMATIYKKYPNDLDAATLYADS